MEENHARSAEPAWVIRTMECCRKQVSRWTLSAYATFAYSNSGAVPLPAIETQPIWMDCQHNRSGDCRWEMDKTQGGTL